MNVLGKVKCYIETNDNKNSEENNNCFQEIKVVSCRRQINIVISRTNECKLLEVSF